MKKIINNKVYDTDTAECVAVWDNGLNTSDFNYCAESLYRKRTGEFFLHGEGHINSKYAVSCGSNEWRWGEKIIPLTYDAAQKWAERLSGEKYEKIFGTVTEDSDEKVKMTFYISAPAADRLRKSADKAGISISAYLESLIPPMA